MCNSDDSVHFGLSLTTPYEGGIWPFSKALTTLKMDVRPLAASLWPTFVFT